MPIVSVIIPAFNSEKTIEEAIESILMQTFVDYEIIVVDDGSTDGMKQKLDKYKNKIKYIYQDNQGVAGARYTGIIHSNGKYLALLDSDDYWINPLKLEKQVKFLDDHKDFSICFHNALILWQNKTNNPQYFCDKEQKKVSGFEDVVEKWFMPTSSILLRKSCLTLPKWFREIQNEDYTLHLLLAGIGKVGYINNVMSIYRKSEGSYSFNPRITPEYTLEQIIKLLQLIDDHFNYRFNAIISKRQDELEKQLKYIQLRTKYPLIRFVNPKLYLNKIKSILSHF